MTRSQKKASSEKKPRKRKARTTALRCAGCGKPILPWESTRKPGDKAVDIRVGAVLPPPNGKKTAGRPRRAGEDGFIPKERWGRMHLACFIRAMDSTDRFLEDFLG